MRRGCHGTESTLRGCQCQAGMAVGALPPNPLPKPSDAAACKLRSRLCGAAGGGLRAAGAPRRMQTLNYTLKTPLPVCCAAGFAVLRVAGCARLGRRGLSQLAAVGAFSRLRELDVSHLDGLWAKPVGMLSISSFQLRWM